METLWATGTLGHQVGWAATGKDSFTLKLRESVNLDMNEGVRWGGRETRRREESKRSWEEGWRGKGKGIKRESWKEYIRTKAKAKERIKQRSQVPFGGDFWGEQCQNEAKEMYLRPNHKRMSILHALWETKKSWTFFTCFNSCHTVLRIQRCAGSSIQPHAGTELGSNRTGIVRRALALP